MTSENMVYFLSELALMHYGSISFCSSMIAASAMYVARLTLRKSPAWSETLRRYAGYSESQLRECGKMLVKLHSVAAVSKEFRGTLRCFTRVSYSKMDRKSLPLKKKSSEESGVEKAIVALVSAGSASLPSGGSQADKPDDKYEFSDTTRIQNLV